MTTAVRWTDPTAIAAAARRRWRDGTLLRAYAGGDPFPTLEVPLRVPTARELGEHVEAARSWAQAVRRGSRGGRAYDIVEGRIGGRLAGTTALPVRAVVSGYDQAWTLLDVAAEAEAYRDLVARSETVPAAQRWALATPHAALRHAGRWTELLAAYRWLQSHRGSGLHLRQVSAPGVDTKFIEGHRGVLATLLDVPSGRDAFAEALGLATKPGSVRLRFTAGTLGLPAGVTEATLRTDELRQLELRPRRAFIIENEITYLSVPVDTGDVVLWGKGYDASEAASLEWLRSTEVLYWGDLDTHGFGILNRVRVHLPHARSVLMDRETLLEHEARWGREEKPSAAVLPCLTASEQALYADLVTGRYGTGVRLEQERIDWQWALERLH